MWLCKEYTLAHSEHGTFLVRGLFLYVHTIEATLTTYGTDGQCLCS